MSQKNVKIELIKQKDYHLGKIANNAQRDFQNNNIPKI